MRIRVDDLMGPEIAELLAEHIRDMKAISPPEIDALPPAKAGGFLAHFRR